MTGLEETNLIVTSVTKIEIHIGLSNNKDILKIIVFVYLTIKTINTIFNLNKKKDSIMATYTIKDFDDSLWRKFKAKCAMEGISIRDKLIQLIREFVEKK